MRHVSKQAAAVALFGLLAAAPLLMAKSGPEPDQAVAAHVEKRLRDANFDSIHVNVSAGIADLTGTVDRFSKAEKAASIAKKTSGVTGVRNEIEIASEQNDQQIARAVTHEIRMYPHYSIFDWVQGDVKNGVVTLRGSVREPWYAKDYANLAAQVRGVKSVRNELEVLPLSPFDNQIRAQVARAIYANPAIGTRYGFQALPSVHIIVKNGNVRLEGAVLNQMDKTIIEMAARRAGLSFRVEDNLQIVNS
jgi:hyperosmotically inducible protein